MSIRESLLVKIAKEENETLLLEMAAYYEKLIGQVQLKFRKEEPHHLDAVYGIMPDEDAVEMVKIIDREFNRIEGEW